MANSSRRSPLFLFVLLPLLLAGAAPLANPPARVPTSPAAPADAVTIPASVVIPNVDGGCSSIVSGGAEYGDAAVVSYTVGIYPVVVELKHTSDNLYVCMYGMVVPALAVRQGPNAVVYLDRAGLGGAAPNSDTFMFSISYSGTVVAGRGDGSGYNGPAPTSPTDFTAARTQGETDWTAEFSISRALLGGTDWSNTNQSLGLAVAQQWVSAVSDDYGWPNGYYWTTPDSWSHGTVSPAGGSSSTNLHWRALEVNQSIQDLTNRDRKSVV
jgi:hypothetical protein